MNSNCLLLWLLAVPALGAALTAFLPSGKAARAWALVVSLLTLAVALAIWRNMQPLGNAGLLMEFGAAGDHPAGIQQLGVTFHLGIDAISYWLVMLTVFLSPLAIASSFAAVHEREKEYYGWMLLLMTAMLGVFVARDLLLFYVFFELTLVPMFFIIGIWGGPQRRLAAGKFFLFTFAGSVFTLLSALYLAMHAGHGGTPSFDINDIVKYAQTIPRGSLRLWLALGLLAGFAVKVPLFPVHTWLPLAHTEAPTAGSVILAGVLLKLGTYGLLRLAIPIALVGGVADGGVMAPCLLRGLGVLCLIGIIYGALAAWVQRDIKKLVAYSSVSHLGFCVLGLLALNDIGMQGSVLYMVNHGLSTGAMFLVIGMIYERFHTRDIDELSGLAKKMPVMAFFFVLFAFSSIGLPGLNGFVSEFLTILGAFTSPHLGVRFGAWAALGVILGAIYMLHLVGRVIWGPLKTPHGAHASDINAREVCILVPLALAIIVLGVCPGIITDSLVKPLENLATPVALHTDAVASPTLLAGVSR